MYKVIERILNLLAFLLTVGRPVTADEIRHTVQGYDQPSDEAFRRTFERDKDLLRSLGVPLQTTPTDIWEVELGYVVRSDEYVLEDPGLTDEERKALMIAAETVRFGGESTSLAAIFKLGGAVGSMDASPVSADLGYDLRTLGDVFGAVDGRSHIRFAYRSKPRRVAPYGLVHRFGRWYVVGPETRDLETPKVFRVDRMTDLEVEAEEGSFTRPADFDPEAVLAALTVPRPEHVATVRFDSDVAAVAVNRWRDAAVVSRDESGVTVEAPYDDAASVITWVLGFAHRAEILSPEVLRDAMRAHLETVA